MKKKIVIALGGNALGNTPEEQKEIVKKTAKYIVDLVIEGNKVIVTHGNGPQVGLINNAFSYAKDKTNIEMPFAECGAMSEGYIGFHLQQAIQKELMHNHLKRNCVTLITQVLVDQNDLAFDNPTKPIGNFLSKEEADRVMKDKGYMFKEDAGRGYRRVVPSPKPLKVIELSIIKKLAETQNIVIACGGGGIPVIEENNSYHGIDAVIDKDMTSALLASSLKADVLLILTAVDDVKINYNRPDEQKIKVMSVKEAKKHIINNQFAPGSMLPKIEACNLFLEKNPKGKAIITSLASAKKALKGQKGTLIKR